jgi:hypothetical protein
LVARAVKIPRPASDSTRRIELLNWAEAKVRRGALKRIDGIVSLTLQLTRAQPCDIQPFG